MIIYIYVYIYIQSVYIYIYQYISKNKSLLLYNGNMISIPNKMNNKMNIIYNYLSRVLQLFPKHPITDYLLTAGSELQWRMGSFKSCVETAPCPWM